MRSDATGPAGPFKKTVIPLIITDTDNSEQVNGSLNGSFVVMAGSSFHVLGEGARTDPLVASQSP